jgi:hypothetical protein
MFLRFALLALLVSMASGCVVVRGYEREHLAHPSMAATVDPLEQASLRKLHQSREAASGGDSLSAGGGCGCSN